MEDGVEGEGEKNHQTHTQHHRTQLQLSPVDDIQDLERRGDFSNYSRTPLQGHHESFYPD